MFLRIFSYNSSRKRKLWAIFLPRVRLWKNKHREAGLKHKPFSKLKLEAWRFRIFRDTLILVFLNENCCLCICFTELYFFYWLLVVSLVILIPVLIVFSRSVNIACRSTQNSARYKHNKLFIMLERNSVNVHSNQHSPQLALQKWEPDGRIGDFGNFFNGFSKSPPVVRSSWILNECHLCCKIVKYCILSEVCLIKTVPHSTVSSQMWCINGIKGWFTRTQICWQDFAK